MSECMRCCPANCKCGWKEDSPPRPDCGALEDQVHPKECDRVRCDVCGKQIITCRRHLNPDVVAPLESFETYD